ncbi:MBL fold metallo-hydrolase [Sporofaciens sp. SGI.106]|uniref:MBL fold metallo-hydrolase n=1 Tax=Sporofaciens sp. SGI.106 TaxID=3420568 RepID=UPI003CFF4347
MGKRIHQLKIDFHVTPEIKRYVYVYIIEGEFCYLIDSGVDGAEEIIANFLKSIGRKLTDVKCIFLTHAHPDHIGSAAKIREMTGCKIYASAGESRWIRDIDLQFAERPIPNFYTLVNESVTVDEILKDGDCIKLEDGLTIEAVGTPGHSCDELSYLLPEESCIFTGDAIPVRGDIPIWIQRDDNRKSLEKLKEIKGADIFYPAWDETYDREQAMDKIEDAMMLMDEIQQNVDRCKGIAESLDEMVVQVCNEMKTPHFLKNPLFRRTIESFL